MAPEPEPPSDPNASVRHLAFFRAAGAAPPASSQYQALTAGLLVLRLLDKWQARHTGQRELKFREFVSVKRTVDTIEDEALRRILGELVDTVSAFANGSADKRAVNLVAYGQVLEHDAQWEPAADVFATAIDIIADRPQDRELLPLCYQRASYSHRQLGDLDLASSLASRGMEVAEELRDVRWVMKFRLTQALLAVHKGDLPSAEQTLDAIIVDAERADLPQIAAEARHDRGNVAYDRNQYEQAAEMFYVAMIAYADPLKRSRAMHDLGTALADLGHIAYARRVYSVVRQSSVEATDLRTFAGLNLMRISTLDGDGLRFERFRRELMSERMHGRLRAHYHLLSGQGLRRFGDEIQAREEFARAIVVAEENRVYKLVIEADAMLKTRPDERPICWKNVSPKSQLAEILDEIANKRGAFAGATD